MHISETVATLEVAKDFIEGLGGSGLHDQFGGHMYAAGLTMPVENVAAFRERFERIVREGMTEDMRIPEEEVDIELSLTDVNDRLLNIVEHMSPFGPHNMRPTFLTRGVIDTGSARIVGDDPREAQLGRLAVRPVDRVEVPRRPGVADEVLAAEHHRQAPHLGADLGHEAHAATSVGQVCNSVEVAVQTGAPAASTSLTATVRKAVAPRARTFSMVRAAVTTSPTRSGRSQENR